MGVNLKHAVVIGSSGRLGRMLRARWRVKPDLPFRPIYQSRDPLASADLVWSSLTGAAGFATDLQKILGAPRQSVEGVELQNDSVMVVFAGVTPSSSGNLEDNTPITRACLQAASAANITRVLIASSSAVYGTTHPDSALTEGMSLTATSVYGRQKQQMEQLCALSEWASLQISVLRIGNVAGADALMLNHAKAPTELLELDIFADGKSLRRSYIGPETLADVIQSLIMAPQPLPKVLNVSAPLPIYMDDLAQAAGIAWRPRAAPEGLRQQITLDTSLIETLHHFALCDSSPSTMCQQMKRIGL